MSNVLPLQALQQVSIVIPAYNEEAAIGGVTAQLHELYPGTEIIVVDDGSTDHTSERVHSSCKVLRREVNRGYGASLKTAIQNASGQFVLFYDGDGQFDPADVRRLIEAQERSKADMVTGMRTKDSHVPLIRRPGKFVFSAIVQIIAGAKIPDVNCGLRMTRREILLRYLHLLPDGFSASTTLTMLCLKRGFRLEFVPIEVKKRQGKSSVRQVHDGINSLISLVRLMALFDPLRIFLPVALVLLLVSFLYSFYEAVTMGLGVPTLGAIGMIGGMLSFFLGIVCDQISALRLEFFERTRTEN